MTQINYEIIDGVRRTKAASLIGKRFILAEILTDGKQIEIKEVPIDSLGSPFKQNIQYHTTEQVNRFHRILDATKANKKLPPIQVRLGHRGPKINEVSFDTYGGE